MNSLNQSLIDIVIAYTDYDFSNKSYPVKQLILAEKQKIEVQLITIFSQFLTEKGVEDEQINHQRRILLSFFHPDKFLHASPEIRWLEHSLSDGNNNGVCFKLIDNCADELKKPSFKKEDDTFQSEKGNFFDIDELLAQLEKKREGAKTLTQRALIDSTITLLQNIKHLKHISDDINPRWLKAFLISLPHITSGFCIGLYLEELSLLYAVLYLTTESGNWLKKRDEKSLQYLGNVVYGFSQAISNASTTLMFYFISINFAAMNTTYYLGIEACSKVYQLINYAISPKIPASSANTQSHALIIPPQYFLPGQHLFKTLEVKLIALKLEQYQTQQKMQYFATWRQGCKKSYLIEQALQGLKLIDVKSITAEQKLAEAKIIINNLAKHPYFKQNKSKAKETIEAVKILVQSLVSSCYETIDDPLKIEEDYASIDNEFFISLA